MQRDGLRDAYGGDDNNDNDNDNDGTAIGRRGREKEEDDRAWHREHRPHVLVRHNGEDRIRQGPNTFRRPPHIQARRRGGDTPKGGLAPPRGVRPRGARPVPGGVQNVGCRHRLDFVRGGARAGPLPARGGRGGKVACVVSRHSDLSGEPRHRTHRAWQAAYGRKKSAGTARIGGAHHAAGVSGQAVARVWRDA